MAGPKRVYASKPVGPSPLPSSDSISKTMKSNKPMGTKPEMMLSAALRKKLVRSRLPGSPDFTFPRAKLAVFVHGCYWHRCPKHAARLPKTNRAFWMRKFERNVERDRLNREELQSMGWKVMEIWEHEVRANPKACARRVLAEVRARRMVIPID